MLHGPFGLTKLEKKVPLNGRLAYYELTTVDGSHEVALPKKDAPLVLIAIGQKASRRLPQGDPPTEVALIVSRRVT
ncbi:hypothetical protein E4K10_00155 [Streptomyces sp. T1317-0309]|nr:hypothetical protein E4K10_00155 [Streptomyces sp. T1317-0309]